MGFHKMFEDWGDEGKTTRLLRKVQVALTPRSQLLAAKLANGAVVYGKNRPGFGGRGVFVFRDEIEPELAALDHFLDDEGVFMDVGSNTGVYTLKAAKHYNGRGVVIAVEPFVDVLAVLQHSVLQNGFDNVRLRNFAASDKTEPASFWMNNGLPNTFSLEKDDETARPITVMAVALDDLFAWEGLDRLDFIKIDVESAEARVLKGAQGIIKKYRPIILVEIVLSDVDLHLENYSVFAPPGINKLYIPNESSKIGVPERLGWRRLETPA